MHDEDGLALIAAGHPLPVLINSATRAGGLLDGPEVVARANEFFKARSRGFTVNCLLGRDDDVLAAADAAGLVSLSGGAPLMAINLPPTAVDVPSGVRVEMVPTEDDVQDVIDVCADGYAVYGLPADVVASAFTPAAVLLAEHIVTVVARDHEGPLASAQAIATHGVAWVQWVATRQRAFKKGAGRAVTQAVTAAAFDRGAELATLLASPMGAPLYRQLGWHEVGVVETRVALEPL